MRLRLRLIPTLMLEKMPLKKKQLSTRMLTKVETDVEEGSRMAQKLPMLSRVKPLRKAMQLFRILMPQSRVS